MKVIGIDIGKWEFLGKVYFYSIYLMFFNFKQEEVSFYIL